MHHPADPTGGLAAKAQGPSHSNHRGSGAAATLSISLFWDPKSAYRALTWKRQCSRAMAVVCPWTRPLACWRARQIQELL